MKHLILASLTALALAAGISSPALAQSANETRGTGGQPEAAGHPETSDKPSAQPPPPSIASSLGPLGDLWGARTSLDAARGHEVSRIVARQAMAVDLVDVGLQRRSGRACAAL